MHAAGNDLLRFVRRQLRDVCRQRITQTQRAGNESLGNAAEFACLRLGRFDPFVKEEIRSHVAEHRTAMRRVPVEFTA